MLSQKELELGRLNIGSLRSEEDKDPLILNLITKFTTAYGEMLEGRFKDNAIECEGGSRINYIFHDVFVKSISSVDPL